MSFYSVLLFLHVLGGVGIFVSLGVEELALGRLRRADTLADSRTWIDLLARVRRVGHIAMLANLGAGVWMMAQWWGPQPWIQAAVVGVLGMAVAGVIVSHRGLKRLAGALAAETGPELSEAFRALRAKNRLAP